MTFLGKQMLKKNKHNRMFYLLVDFYKNMLKI